MENITNLTEHEQKFIDLYGNLFEELGRSGTLGKIFALLLLKTSGPDDGITQEEIATAIDRSVSTISRIINTMVDLRYCTYTEDLNDKYRREKRYYVEEGVFKMTKSRTDMRLRESEKILRQLNDLNSRLTDDESDQNLHEVLNELTFSYEIIIELFQDFIKIVEEKYKEINNNSLKKA